jgi:hypothetical protein
VHSKFSQKFASEVSWQKVDASGSPVEEQEDITQGNENVNGGGEPSGNGGGDGGDDLDKD